MTEFLSNILSFPTLFYTGLLGLSLLYWLSSVIGLADFDFEGADVDMDLADIGANNAANNAADSGNSADASGWLSKFRLDDIPVTISVTLVIFLSWIISFLLVHYYQHKIPEGWVEIVVGMWVIVLAPVISVPIAGILLSPLKPLFKKLKEEAEGRKADTLVGRIAVVRTNKVTMDFGDADILSDGASLILKIRREQPNTIKRGDRVIITHYIPDQNVYKVRLVS